MERKTIQTNPYDSAERLAMFERLRRSGDLDREMDDEMGRLLLDLTTFAIGMYRKRYKLYNEPDELYEDCVCCAVESIRKSDPEDPVSVVRYVMASVQNKVRCVMRDKLNREQLLYPYDTAMPSVELGAGLDGSCEDNMWDTLKVFALKTSEEKDVKEDV